ncbi:hypothetical protein Mapa_014815 [Marchantia paleacea]|nr:hypothetical protein Mapa_014815 [Marchantia paleacea]
MVVEKASSRVCCRRVFVGQNSITLILSGFVCVDLYIPGPLIFVPSLLLYSCDLTYTSKELPQLVHSHIQRQPRYVDSCIVTSVSTLIVALLHFHRGWLLASDLSSIPRPPVVVVTPTASSSSSTTTIPSLLPLSAPTTASVTTSATTS